MEASVRLEQFRYDSESNHHEKIIKGDLCHVIKAELSRGLSLADGKWSGF